MDDNYNEYITNAWAEKANSNMDDDEIDVVDGIVDVEIEEEGSVMKHPAELALHQYMENAANGKSTMSVETVKQIGMDVICTVNVSLAGQNAASLVTYVKRW